MIVSAYRIQPSGQRATATVDVLGRGEVPITTMEESAILLPIATVLLVKVQQQDEIAQRTVSLPGWATSVANPAPGLQLGPGWYPSGACRSKISSARTGAPSILSVPSSRPANARLTTPTGAGSQSFCTVHDRSRASGKSHTSPTRGVAASTPAPSIEGRVGHRSGPYQRLPLRS